MEYILIILGIVLVGIDQISKNWASVTLKQVQEIEIWPQVFHLAYVENRGAAFGMMQNMQWFFIIVTIVVIGAILVYWRKIPDTKTQKIYKVSLTLIMSGAIGNLIDRVFLGYVVDMFYFILIDFPVFNVADICVVTGTIIFMIVMILEDLPKKDKAIEG
ncbi:MAG: signal peptidase II [Epulopiscium sp. Nuni2H_MBin003]|nr:MAG: signal peptidase II [Epulopiscium sp. Nuni2H_MBin003]